MKITKLKPVGQRLLVKELKNEYFVTESKIEIVNLTLAKGVVVDVSDELKELFKPKDIIIFPQGTGHSQPYNGELHTWLTLTDIWGIETKTK